MTPKIQQEAMTTPDEQEFIDISAPFDDVNGARACELGIRPLKVKMYDWNEVQAALHAGAASEEEAKSRATPHYAEVSVFSGALKITLLAGAEERGSVVLSIDGEPTVEVWDEFSDSDEPEVSAVFATAPVRRFGASNDATLRLM